MAKIKLGSNTLKAEIMKKPKGCKREIHFPECIEAQKEKLICQKCPHYLLQMK
jgi:hypothetical protein